MWGNFEAHLLEIGLTELSMAAKITEPINQLYNTLFVSIFFYQFPLNVNLEGAVL
jgi:Kef-type K+ transport system membrane component KefB